MARTIRKPEIDYRLEHDPAFLHRIEQARDNLRAGRGTKLEDLKAD